jgi:hypothetical protein
MSGKKDFSRVRTSSQSMSELDADMLQQSICKMAASL